jgi:hypothetical protein
MPVKTQPAHKPVAPRAVAAPAPIDDPVEEAVQTAQGGKIGWTNAVDLTLHLHEANINEAQTFAWGKAFLSMGKDEQGSYKPSLWLKIKAWGKDDPALPALLVAYEPGSIIRVLGRLAYEETPGEKEGVVFKNVIVIASEITPPAIAEE